MLKILILCLVNFDKYVKAKLMLFNGKTKEKSNFLSDILKNNLSIRPFCSAMGSKMVFLYEIFVTTLYIE